MIVELNKDRVKPCPLCADEAFLHTKPRDPLNRGACGSQLFWIKCNNPQCGCTLNSDEDQSVVLDRWNKRW